MSTTIAPVPVAKPPSVAVVGCGWLGLPLATALLAQGYRVVGTTTSAEQLPLLAAVGIEAHLLQLGADFSPVQEARLVGLLRGIDTLVLGIPPRAAVAGGYPQLLRPVHRAVAAAHVQAVVFISTTSVYPDEPRLMHETDAISTRDAASDVLRTEGHFVPRYGQWKSAVVRLGGLIGPGRAPGRFLAGRRDLPGGSAPTNLLHLTDAVGVLQTIIQQNIWGHTLNVSAASHPLRRDFYAAAAHHLNLELPTFRPDEAGGKLIDGSQLRQLVPYRFVHDDVLAAIADCPPNGADF